jgi:hypothetical protein
VWKRRLASIITSRSFIESVRCIEDSQSLQSKNTALVFLEKDITLVLLMLSFIQLTVHQPCTRLDVRLQAKAIPRGFDGAEDFNVSEKEIVWATGLHMSLINTLKRTGFGTDP